MTENLKFPPYPEWVPADARVLFEDSVDAYEANVYRGEELDRKYAHLAVELPLVVRLIFRPEMKSAWKYVAGLEDVPARAILHLGSSATDSRLKPLYLTPKTRKEWYAKVETHCTALLELLADTRFDRGQLSLLTEVNKYVDMLRSTEGESLVQDTVIRHDGNSAAIHFACRLFVGMQQQYKIKLPFEILADITNVALDIDPDNLVSDETVRKAVTRFLKRKGV